MKKILLAGLVTIAALGVFPSPALAASGASVVSPSMPLNVRTGPGTWNARVRTLPNGTPVAIACQIHGQRITVGSTRQTDMWDRLSDGTYVSDAWIYRPFAVPACGAPAAAAAAVRTTSATGRWVHPLPGFPAGHSFRTPQNPNHIGVDIMSFTGTPIRAASAGRVLEVVCNIQAGGSCDQTGSPAMRGCGWYVKILHPGHIATIYCHMVRKGIVTPGQQVQAGQVIGYVGSSGNSSAPHLHFEVHVNAPPTGPQNAIDPIPFMRAHGVVLDKR